MQRMFLAAPEIAGKQGQIPSPGFQVTGMANIQSDLGTGHPVCEQGDAVSGHQGAVPDTQPYDAVSKRHADVKKVQLFRTLKTTVNQFQIDRAADIRILSEQDKLPTLLFPMDAVDPLRRNICPVALIQQDRLILQGRQTARLTSLARAPRIGR